MLILARFNIDLVWCLWVIRSLYVIQPLRGIVLELIYVLIECLYQFILCDQFLV